MPNQYNPYNPYNSQYTTTNRTLATPILAQLKSLEELLSKSSLRCSDQEFRLLKQDLVECVKVGCRCIGYVYSNHIKCKLEKLVFRSAIIAVVLLGSYVLINSDGEMLAKGDNDLDSENPTTSYHGELEDQEEDFAYAEEYSKGK